MPKLTMMRGLPASGKSTKAQELISGDTFRVNRDLLRTMLHFDNWTGKNEKVVIDAQLHLAVTLLLNGKSVVVDDTNLNPKNEMRWAAVAQHCGAEFEVIDMMEGLTVADCLLRNAKREKKVPDHVIRNMALESKYFEFPAIVVCDIDGTLANVDHRRHFVRTDGQKKDWKGFFAAMDKDTLRDDVLEKVNTVCSENDAGLVLVSARPEEYRAVTEKWLLENGVFYDALIMRRTGDKRPDTEVKREMFERYLRRYDIECVFDDRPSVIRMWRELGLEVVDCGDGEEF